MYITAKERHALLGLVRVEVKMHRRHLQWLVEHEDLWKVKDPDRFSRAEVKLQEWEALGAKLGEEL